MKYKYDLHIHTTLSPCAEVLNTPNNILNMAMLANLDFIAITDHNSCKQIPEILKIADSYDFVVVPGIEVTVEGFHVLVYFKDVNDALMFEEDLQPFFEKKKFDSNYGEQVIFDGFDQQIEFYEQDLTAIDIKYKTFYKIARKYETLIFLAHIDRTSTSALKNYSLDDFSFDGIEFSKFASASFKEAYRSYKSLENSDSHCITDIGIEENYLELEEKTIDAFFEKFKARRGD